MTDEEVSAAARAYDDHLATLAGTTGAPELAAAAGDLDRREEERRRPDGEVLAVEQHLEERITALEQRANAQDQFDADFVDHMQEQNERLARLVVFLAQKLGCADELEQFVDREDLARGVAQ